MIKDKGDSVTAQMPVLDRDESWELEKLAARVGHSIAERETMKIDGTLAV